MNKLVWVLPASMICACAANQKPLQAIPMATVEVPLSEGAEPAQMTEDFPPEEQEVPPPELPELTQDEFMDAYMHVASCYDFHIPPGAQSGFADNVRLVTYTPCILASFERVMNGLSKITVKTSTLSLQPVRPGIFLVRSGVTLELHKSGYSPQLCVEPVAVGGGFPDSMRCSNLGHEVGTDKYSLIGLTPWYIFARELEKYEPKTP